MKHSFDIRPWLKPVLTCILGLVLIFRPGSLTTSIAWAVGVLIALVGAVQQPGVVTVAAGARTADAVNACGGLLPQADAERVNMAQPVKDGQQSRVPEKKAAGNAATGDAAAGREDGGLVNLNTADEKALDALPGVGPATARKIIEYRESEGGFQCTEDLMKIKGIGQAKYDKLKDKVTI